MSRARNICVGKKYSHEFFQHYNFAKIRTCDSSRALVPNSKGEKKAWPVPRFQCTFRLSDDTTGCAAIFASYRSHRSPSLFHSCHRRIYIYTYIYIPIYSRSVPPVRFTAFPPRCIHKTNPNSHEVVLMPGERMRNAYACTPRIPVATGSMSSLCPCVNTRPRSLSLVPRARVLRLCVDTVWKGVRYGG